MSAEGVQVTLIFTAGLLTIFNILVIVFFLVLKVKKPSNLPLILFFIHFISVAIGILVDTSHSGWNSLGYGMLIFVGVGTVLLNGLFTLVYRAVTKKVGKKAK